MAMQDIQNTLIDIISEHSLHNVDKVGISSDLRKDHGIDSLKIAEMIVDIEEEFNFQFEASALSIETFRTVESLLKYVQSRAEVA